MTRPWAENETPCAVEAGRGLSHEKGAEVKKREWKYWVLVLGGRRLCAQWRLLLQLDVAFVHARA